MTARTAAARPRTAVDEAADAHLEQMCRLDPVSATADGLQGHESGMTDYSPAGLEARAALCRRTLASLDALPVADAVDEVTVAVLRERLGLALARHDAGLDGALVGNIDTPVQGLREVFDVQGTGTPDEVTAVLDRLDALPAALAGYRESLLAARAAGWRPTLTGVRTATEQAVEFAGDGAPAAGFFTTFVDGLDLTGTPAAAASDPRGAARALADRATAAYADLADWLRTDLLPAATTDDACGRDAYALHSQYFVGDRVDLDETYAWGLEELARIEARMAQVGRALDPDAPAGDDPASVAAAVAAGIAVLDADPARRIEGAEAFRDWMQAASDAAVAELGGTHFDIPEPIRTLRCRLAPSSSGVIYYTSPSEDFSRPGQMWWSVPEGVTSFSTWRETSTVYHEGVPGHHLQIGQTAWNAARLNRYRRYGVWVSGHGEGWALYAERLMEELGYLDEPGDLMGMLDAHALRAARVVVDIGVHCRLPAPAEVGGGTWDAAQVLAFMTAHTRMGEASTRFETERYLTWPGQAPSYKLGERVWLALREDARRRDGDAFDLAAWHRRALDLGSVPLDVLRKALA
ncbi:DUF885 domain-containing protein [Kineosporia sp. R_H_3]|uniref:DUF885 domain-containing protein n=1 Tax=Kineosporia sp. R_H_3 TaxID=1961848 RepID=UPI001E3DEFFC|nr:DUF885 domain-containing protein [Kineosporia sp. R_H_3]